MPGEDMKGAVRGLNEALVKMDLEKLVSPYAEDAVLATPEGRFEGKQKIRQYWNWQFGLASELKSTETEFHMVVEGNKLAAEHIIEATMKNGMKWSAPISCLYEFSDGAIKLHRMTFDRLTIARQAAKGWLPKKIVNSVVGQMEKGLR